MISENIANAIEIVSGFIKCRFPVDMESICDELGIKIKDNLPLVKMGISFVKTERR